MIKMETDELYNEDVSPKNDCNLCKEINYEVGQKTGYGVLIYRIGSLRDGWFATLSPKTGSNPKLDFTIQLMPSSHLTHFSQIDTYPKLAESYGIAFSKLCKAMTTIIMENESLKATAEEKILSVPIATYGKSTNWKEKKEHLHIKIFPFRGNIGQPYTVDSSFGRKEIFKEEDKEFIKMDPVKKVDIDEDRFNKLTEKLIRLLK
jgi:hypothetical protein